MTAKIRAYVSSSYDDLTEYRKAALDLLNRAYNYDGHGMEDNAVHPDLVKKSLDDARNARIVILIVAFRYGTPLADFDGKSLVELEYEVASEAQRDIFVFCRRESAPIPLPHLDDRVTGLDNGVRVKAFRKRLYDNRHLVGEFDDLPSFKEILGRTLAQQQALHLEQRESELSLRDGPSDPTVAALNAYCVALINEKERFERHYVPLAATTAASQRTDADFEHPAIASQTTVTGSDRLITVEDVAEALVIHRQFCLIGEPGAGKTVTLSALELAAARRFLNDPRAPFPLRIDAATWQPDCQDFASLIADELQSKTGVRSFPPSRLLLLVDGVVDSAAARPHEPLPKIEAWLQKQGHPRSAAVLAVRTRTTLSASIPVVRIQPLDDARVESFVVKRLGEENGRVLLQQIGWHRRPDKGKRDILQLTRSPFNLLLICMLQSREGTPPATQGELMRRVVLAAHQREFEKHGGTLALPDFLDSLGAIAIGMIHNRAKLAADKAWLRKMLGNPEDLDVLLTLSVDCLMMQERPGRAVFEFTHRLFLEYCAAEFVRNHPEQLDGLLRRPRYDLGQRKAQRFDEVIQTLIDLESSVEMVEKIAAYDPFLAASCLASIPDDAGERDRAEGAVVEALVVLLANSEHDAREAATGRLADLGTTAVQALRRTLRNSVAHWVRRSAVRALAQIPDIGAVETIVGALADANRWVREEAAQAIRRFDAKSRRLLLKAIESLSRSHDMDQKVAERLGAAILDLDPHLQETVAAITGIVVTAPTQPPDEPMLAVSDEDSTGEHEHDVDHVSPEQPAPSWGFGWLSSWTADPGDDALAARGRAWLRSAPARDAAWSRVWTALWFEFPGDDDLAWLARDWLTNAPRDATSWSYVWRYLSRICQNDNDLRELGAKWLREAAAVHPGWPSIWDELWRANFNRDELDTLGRRWLESVKGDIDLWSVVWMALVQANPSDTSLDAIGRKWIAQARLTNPSWGFVWTTLWKTTPDDEALIQAGTFWLQEVPAENGSWGFIWPALWKHAPLDPELEDIARRWLWRVSPDHRSWTFVWEKLWSARRSETEPDTSVDYDLIAQARNWLTQIDHENPRWGFVWSAIIKFAGDDPDLLDFGRSLLADTSDRNPYWSAVWQELWDFGEDRDTLAATALSWLESGGIEHRGFRFVWECLRARNPEDINLRRIAIDWLNRTPVSNHGWPFILQMTLKSWPKHPETVALGESFLNEMSAQENSWSSVWQHLWDFGGNHETLFSSGRSWLTIQEHENPAFPFVLNRLRADSPGDEHLHHIAIAWLKSSPHDRTWTHTWWQMLRTWYGDPDLIALGRSLISSNSGDEDIWILVWENLWDYGDERPFLVTIVRDWLAAHGSTHSFLGFVWKRLLAHAPNDDTFREHALTWLRQTPKDHDAWPFVWPVMMKLSPSDPVLLLLGREFITTISGKEPSWTVVWEGLWDHGDDRSFLEPLGFEWLTTHSEGHRGFTFLWERLWIAFPGDPRLIQIAARFLERSDPTQPDWPNLWRIVADSGMEDEAFIAQGRSWMNQNSAERPGWARVWAYFALHKSDDPKLVTRGWQWMESRFFHRRSWPQVWDVLWQKAPAERQRLAVLAVDWAQKDRADRSDEIRPWDEISRLLESDEQRRSTALKMVEGADSSKSHCGNAITPEAVGGA